MLSGKLPFKSENNSQIEIAKEIVKKELTFEGREWKTRSEECINLVKGCLMKNISQRVSLDEIMKHKWYKSFELYTDKDKLEFIKKEAHFKSR